jgi:hypothetical protein
MYTRNYVQEGGGIQLGDVAPKPGAKPEPASKEEEVTP